MSSPGRAAMLTAEREGDPTTIKEAWQMEQLPELLNAVNTVGFPIVCVVAMFFMWNKEREAHKEEMAKITEALNNNTIAMTRLSDRLEG